MKQVFVVRTKACPRLYVSSRQPAMESGIVSLTADTPVDSLFFYVPEAAQQFINENGLTDCEVVGYQCIMKEINK